VRLSVGQSDRAAGVLLGLAAGDALGVPYEFGTPPTTGERAEMLGGGLGNFAPGEWSDDTSMALAIARVAATGADLNSPEALDAIAAGFVEWYAAGPPDIGIQTSRVLAATTHRLRDEGGRPGEVMTVEAQAYHLSKPQSSAGNGALMRTASVALAFLDDRAACAEASRATASLTHADPLAGDSCVLWSEAIRVAVVEGRFDVLSGIDLLPARHNEWRGWLDEPLEAPDGARFTPNGFTVTALQAAVAAVASTPAPVEDPAARSFACQHLQEALHAAVRIGNDTDTVAAIAGGLLGARWGASAVPWRWRRAVHGWPGLDGRDLVSLATLTVRGGHDDHVGWPSVDVVRYTDWASAEAVPHPVDDGVLLGTHATHDHGATAVVAACRVGRHQPSFGSAEVVIESRLMDSEVASDNANLAFTLYDAADAVRGLRAEGHTVLVHCVAAQQRTPSIAVAYGVLLGHDADGIRAALRKTLYSTRGSGWVWEAAALGSKG